MTDFKPYRFSPITSESELRNAISHIHAACYDLLDRTLGLRLANAGNVGIFCHYDDEFAFLKSVRAALCEPSNNPDLKYFTLKAPISINVPGSPEATYTHLYIRKPDPYRAHVGDIDFYMPASEYERLKNQLVDGKSIQGVRLFERSDLDMIELYHPDVDTLAYISTGLMAQKVRIKLSDSTKL